jgi:S-DNA-T family DNA segregation ATPase FtsK/SpoIIIE
MEPGRDPSDPVPIGFTSTGEEATIQLPQRSLLIGGSPGSGKSVGLAQIVAAAALSNDTELWLVDPKGGVELCSFWSGCAARSSVTPDDSAVLIADLVDVMEKRYEDMNLQKIRKVEPSKRFPLIVLVVDEMAEITASGDKKRDQELQTSLRRLVAKGRAAGITPVFSTQKPDSSTVPTNIRDLCSTRIAYRCGTEAQAITILGDEAVKVLGADAHAIGADTPGLAYLYGEEGSKVTRLRSFFLEDSDLEAIASKAEAYRNVSPIRFDLPSEDKEEDQEREEITTCADHQADSEGSAECSNCRVLWQEHALNGFKAEVTQ